MRYLGTFFLDGDRCPVVLFVFRIQQWVADAKAHGKGEASERYPSVSGTMEPLPGLSRVGNGPAEGNMDDAKWGAAVCRAIDHLALMQAPAGRRLPRQSLCPHLSVRVIASGANVD